MARVSAVGHNSGKRTCKPNSVVCGHSSRRRVTADAHQRPTRRFRHLLEPPVAHRAECAAPPGSCGGSFPPYLVLLRVGFTLPPALPPERCALTAPFHPYPDSHVPKPGTWGPGRYVFCGTGRLRALTPASRTLSGTLPCGVRTFLPRRFTLSRKTPAATARSSCRYPVYRGQGSGVRFWRRAWDCCAWLCG